MGMKIAHILVPDFAIQVEILRNPGLRRKPVVIGCDDLERIVAQSSSTGHGPAPRARLVASTAPAVGRPSRRGGPEDQQAIRSPHPNDRRRENTAGNGTKPVSIGAEVTTREAGSDWPIEGVVYACSPVARRSGIKSGMPLRQAQQLAPLARYLPLEAQRVQDAHRALMGCLENFSPLRESIRPGEICIEASGLEGLYGPDATMLAQLGEDIAERTGLISKIGLAGNRFTAAAAARLADLGGTVIVLQGEEAQFLAPIEIDMLDPTADAQRLLARLGLTTLGQVADLPAGALSRTLGREGEKLHRLARGIDRRPLVAEYDEPPLSAHVTLDWKLELLAALVGYAELLVGQLAAELQTAGLAAGNLIVEVEQETGERLTAWGYLRPASGDRRKLFERVTGLLERLPYSEGAVGLKISLTPLQPVHLGDRQIPLDQGNALGRDPLGQTLHSIRIRFGDGSIRDAAAVPGPPPEPIEVRVGADGGPTAVYRNHSWTRIESIQLHWRMEGDWWWNGPDDSSGLSSFRIAEGVVAVPQPGDGTRKDYYQVVTWSGEILVLLCTPQNERWYLHPAAKPSQWPLL